VRGEKLAPSPPTVVANPSVITPHPQAVNARVVRALLEDKPLPRWHREHIGDHRPSSPMSAVEAIREAKPAAPMAYEAPTHEPYVFGAERFGGK
jgi:hypothetical protein